jgi:tetratricopeptide (TPR) repeat protein
MTKTEAHTAPPSKPLARLRRGSLWLVVTTWVPAAIAVIIALIVARDIERDKAELRRLQADLSDAGASLATAQEKRDRLAKEVESLQKSVVELREREERLRAAVDSNDPEVAIAKVRAQLGGRSPGERADSLWRRGQDFLDEKKLDLAERLFEESRKEDPLFAPPINGLGRVAAERGQLAVAEKFYRNAISTDPKFKPGYFNLAHVYYLKRKYDEAEQVIRKVLEIDPGYQEAAALLKKIEAARKRPEPSAG